MATRGGTAVRETGGTQAPGPTAQPLPPRQLPTQPTSDQPGVTMTKPLDRQYQAMIEVVVADRESFARFTTSDGYQAAAVQLATTCAVVHAARVHRCITTKHDGRITLAEVRGVAVADLPRKLGATSQTHDDVSREFLPPADLVRS